MQICRLGTQMKFPAFQKFKPFASPIENSGRTSVKDVAVQRLVKSNPASLSGTGDTVPS